MCQKNSLASYNLCTVHVPYGIFFNNIQLLSLQILVLKLRGQMRITKQFGGHFEETKQACISKKIKSWIIYITSFAHLQ